MFVCYIYVMLYDGIMLRFSLTDREVHEETQLCEDTNDGLMYLQDTKRRTEEDRLCRNDSQQNNT